jgi:NitT/TauT family transport system substrate-binding protein
MKNNLPLNSARRDFLREALAVGGMGLSGLMASPLLANTLDRTSKTEPVVKIGYLPIADATALLLAETQGYLQEEGLEVAPPERVNSWTALVRGFFSGRYNVVHFLNPIPVWLRYHFNVPVKVVAWAHTNGSGVVTAPHLNARSFTDLGGKQVGVPYWFSMHNMVLQMGLRHAGLTPVIRSSDAPLAAHEVNLRLLPPPLMVWALQAGNIDAYIVAEPNNASGEIQAGARLLRFTGDIWRNHPCCVVCMDERDTKAYPQWAQKVVNAMVRAQIFAQNNKAQIPQILSQEGRNYLPVSTALLDKAINHYAEDENYLKTGAIRHQDWGVGRIDFAPWPYPSATRLIVDNLKQTLMGHANTRFLQKLDSDFVVNDLVDYDFVRAAMQRYSGWEDAPGIDYTNPFEREEMIVF